MIKMIRLALVLALLTSTWPHDLTAQAVCLPEWTLEERLRIGSLDGPDALSWVMDLTVGPDGRVYVAQTFEPSVSVFSTSGHVLGRIGQAGQGPGEFDTAVLRLGFAGDTLWASDLRSTQFFTTEGRYLGRSSSFRTYVREQGSNFTPGMPLPDGSVLGYRFLTRGKEAIYQTTPVPLLRFSRDGRVVDSVAFTRREATILKGGIATEHPLDSWLGESRLPVAMSADGSTAVLIGDVKYGANPAYALVGMDLSGDTTFAFRVPFDPRGVTRSERDWLTQAYAASHAGDYLSGTRPNGGVDRGKEILRQQARDAIEFPEHHPPVRRIVVGTDSTLWVLRDTPYPDRVDRWHIFDRRGQQIAHVRIAEGRGSPIPWHPRLNLFSASAKEVWATSVDDFDVSYIHWFNVVSVGCSA